MFRRDRRRHARSMSVLSGAAPLDISRGVLLRCRGKGDAAVQRPSATISEGSRVGRFSRTGGDADPRRLCGSVRALSPAWSWRARCASSGCGARHARMGWLTPGPGCAAGIPRAARRGPRASARLNLPSAGAAMVEHRSPIVPRTAVRGSRGSPTGRQRARCRSAGCRVGARATPSGCCSGSWWDATTTSPHTVPFGAHLRYLVFASRPRRVVVGCLARSSTSGDGAMAVAGPAGSAPDDTDSGAESAATCVNNR